MPSLGLLIRTLSQYDPGQLLNYAARRMARPKVDLRPAPPLRARSGTFAHPIVRPYYETQAGSFRLLNLEYSVTSDKPWHPDAPMLWLYTLHYHEALSATGHSAQQKTFISHWMANNPPPAGVGWHPYPISLRVAQWIKWLMRGETPPEGMIQSLATQLRYLTQILETHLGANHYFSNAVALSAAGFFFEGPEAESWRRSGFAILAREFPKQYLADGAHFELSASYHGLLLESILDLENIANAYGWDAGRPWRQALPRARHWMTLMTRPDGGYPQFNDCARSAAPAPGVIDAYARAIGLPPADKPAPGMNDMAESGYSRFDAPRYTAFADSGRFGPRTQPGHGHCDMLSFELSVDGTLVFSNTGTSTYDRNVSRMAERSTTAHNTVQVGQAEQTEIWAAFRAGRKARITGRRVEAGAISATHDGYRPLGISHLRHFRFTPDTIVIQDELIGRRRPATARLHLVPGIAPVMDGADIIAGPVRISAPGATVRLADYDFAEDFNLLVPAKVIELDFTGRLETRILLT